VVVGAGHAGLAMSRELSRRGLEHVVLEQGRVGESWRSQRWDSFTLNTPGWYSDLEGDEAAGKPDGFASRDAFVAYLGRYAERIGAPIRTGVQVTGVVSGAAGDGFTVRTDSTEPIETR